MNPSLAMGMATRPLRVLAVVELGSNWGHLLRLLPLVRALRARGHEVVLVAPEVEQARKLFLGEAIDIVPSPGASFKAPLGPLAHINHYVQLLDRCVFRDDTTLEVTLRQWTDLLAAWQPDVALTDFAPGALFAAHLHRLPLVQVAIGWEAPPAGLPLPTVRPWEPLDLAAMQRLEAHLLERLNRRCHAFGVPPLSHLSNLYAVGTQLLATWPEADHFAPRAPTARYIGPIYSADHGRPAAWPETRGPGQVPRVLVYLSPDPRNSQVIEALRRAPVQVIAVLPGIGKPAMSRWATARFQIWDEPLQLQPLVETAHLVISNAGHGLVAASLLAGVPMLVLPRTAEQALITRRLTATGAVHSMWEGGGPHRCAQLVQAMLGDNRARLAAQAVAGKYAGSTQLRTVLSVVAAVERAAGDGVNPTTGS